MNSDLNQARCDFLNDLRYKRSAAESSRASYRWAKRQHWTTVKPFYRVELPKRPCRLPVWLEREEQARLNTATAMPEAFTPNVCGNARVRVVRDYLKGLIEQAGIDKPITPHKLRHTYATRLLESGAELVDIQALLGHANLATTQIYTHVSDERMAAVVAKL
ncbi:tyrosine-type recombinase/integrase [Allochromatium palmeri]|nr:tyrosine-type recombinase/integrase [Allochromatium palmeri]